MHDQRILSLFFLHIATHRLNPRSGVHIRIASIQQEIDHYQIRERVVHFSRRCDNNCNRKIKISYEHVDWKGGGG